jgi:hypothetical protein
MAGSDPAMVPPLNRSVISLTPSHPCAAGYWTRLMASLVRVSIHAASAARILTCLTSDALGSLPTPLGNRGQFRPLGWQGLPARQIPYGKQSGVDAGTNCGISPRTSTADWLVVTS